MAAGATPHTTKPETSQTCHGATTALPMETSDNPAKHFCITLHTDFQDFPYTLRVVGRYPCMILPAGV